MGKYFGTDGFRGEANVGLTVEHAFKVGRFLGWYYSKEHKAKVVIGKDTRRSSYMFEYALVAGLTASGADVYLLHVTTTPSVSYVVRTDGFDVGIMISASHNPYYDNGIKIINGQGKKLEAETEAKIEEYIDGKIEELPLAKREYIGRTVDYAMGRNRYIGYLISIATRSFKDKTVALYGEGAVHTIKGGTGSGDVNARETVNIREGLKNAGYRIMNGDWLDQFEKAYADGKSAWRDEIWEKYAESEE